MFTSYSNRTQSKINIICIQKNYEHNVTEYNIEKYLKITWINEGPK